MKTVSLSCSFGHSWKHRVSKTGPFNLTHPYYDLLFKHSTPSRNYSSQSNLCLTVRTKKNQIAGLAWTRMSRILTGGRFRVLLQLPWRREKDRATLSPRPYILMFSHFHTLTLYSLSSKPPSLPTLVRLSPSPTGLPSPAPSLHLRRACLIGRFIHIAGVGVSPFSGSCSTLSCREVGLSNTRHAHPHPRGHPSDFPPLTHSLSPITPSHAQRLALSMNRF